MFNLTPHEKLIIIFVGLIALCGLTLNYYRKNSAYQTYKINKFISEKILKDKPLNINEAAKEELIKIPGIGDKTAQAIIDYRREIGNFTSLEELKNIKGISENKFNKIKDCLAIE